MPGGGPRYREAMGFGGQPFFLLQDSGLRPRVGDGPGTTPKLPWAALRVALREITVFC